MFYLYVFSQLHIYIEYNNCPALKPEINFYVLSLISYVWQACGELMFLLEPRGQWEESSVGLFYCLNTQGGGGCRVGWWGVGI